MLVQVRLKESGKVVVCQHISDDSGSFQCRQLADRLLTKGVSVQPGELYWTATKTGVCLHKGDFDY